MPDSLDNLSLLEQDALQEIMNIGFGQAAADLADIINLHVILSVPKIAVLKTDQVLDYIRTQIPETTDMSMITQFFSGKFNGASFLVFPRGEGRKLLQIFDEELQILGENYDIDILEKETLIEVGNIIIGACVGKVAEMLGDVVGYAPPRFYSHDQIHDTLDDILNQDSSFAILFKTVFNFENQNVSGYLFLVCQQEIMPWIKQAITEFLSQYA